MCCGTLSSLRPFRAARSQGPRLVAANDAGGLRPGPCQRNGESGIAGKSFAGGGFRRAQIQEGKPVRGCRHLQRPSCHPLPTFAPSQCSATLRLARTILGLPHVATYDDDDKTKLSGAIKLVSISGDRWSRLHGAKNVHEREVYSMIGAEGFTRLVAAFW